MKIKEDKKYFGEMVHNWTIDHKNKYVITGMQQGGATIEKRIGRVAQVRLESGDFGSDNVLLRHCDDILQQHMNQSFWLIPDEFKDYLDQCFKDVYIDDADVREYTLNEGDPEKGFIVESKIKEGESTPMRDLKNGILSKLDEIIK